VKSTLKRRVIKAMDSSKTSPANVARAAASIPKPLNNADYPEGFFIELPATPFAPREKEAR
jgi:hypothetical protein